MENNVFDWHKSSQLSIVQFLLAIFIPSGVAFAGFHGVLPLLVADGLPVMIAWPTVASVMLLGFVLVAVFLMHREAKGLNISLAARMGMKKLTLKQWGLYIGIAVVALVFSILAQSLVIPLMNVFHFTIPAYMPFFLNPGIDPMTADLSVVSPGLPLSGNYGLLLLVGITLFLNILTEELYFRAWMMPKLSRYGAWGWIMNGIFFALYHTFQIWLLPTLLVTSLFFAFIFYHSKSIWPCFAAHLVGNLFLSILGILMLIMR
jgi:membrane protease YdiL (CAAX protease family)